LFTRAGDAVLYAPHELQDYSTSPDVGTWHLLWVHFVPKAQWFPWLRWPAGSNGLRLLHTKSGEVREHVAAAMRRMISISRREIPGARDLAANALEEALLWANVVTSQDRWLVMDERVRKAIDYLTARPHEPFVLGKLARHCGVSVSRLACLFKEETGTSPQQFFERHRMQHASQLLRLTSLSITEIAGEVGYADPFYFSKRFRRYSGKNPSGYRQP
jgi:AraC family transcriptional regulator of arabinose operon